MAEESDLEKTEAATPRRLEKAREEGQVARSRELNTFLLLATGVATLWLLGKPLYQSFRSIFRAGMGFDLRILHDSDAMLAFASAAAFNALLAILPLLVLLVLVAIIASVLLGGLTLSSKSLSPKFERLSLLKGLKRMGSLQTLVELLKTLAKALIIGGIGAWVIWSHQESMVALMQLPPQSALIGGMRLVALCCGLITAALLIVVGIDVPWQLYSHYKKLRMSKQEVKEEHKETEGDPQLKAKIRQQQRSLARRRMMAEVPHADVVVTNPSHYAVALRYDEEAGQGAPKVVAKGRGLLAQRIRELANTHRIPSLSSPPLARALYRHVRLDEEIPEALYRAVAEVLAWVYQLRHWQQGLAAMPSEPIDLPVPSHLDPVMSESNRSQGLARRPGSSDVDVGLSS